MFWRFSKWIRETSKSCRLYCFHEQKLQLRIGLNDCSCVSRGVLNLEYLSVGPLEEYCCKTLRYLSCISFLYIKYLQLKCFKKLGLTFWLNTFLSNKIKLLSNCFSMLQSLGTFVTAVRLEENDLKWEKL